MRGGDQGGAYMCLNSRLHFQNVDVINNSGNIAAFCRGDCRFTRFNTNFNNTRTNCH